MNSSLVYFGAARENHTHRKKKKGGKTTKNDEAKSKDAANEGTDSIRKHHLTWSVDIKRQTPLRHLPWAASSVIKAISPSKRHFFRPGPTRQRGISDRILQNYPKYVATGVWKERKDATKLTFVAKLIDAMGGWARSTVHVLVSKQKVGQRLHPTIGWPPGGSPCL